MLIGRVSELTGATRKAIRHYESIGLIKQPERRGNYRTYSEHDVIVISMIRRATTLGFTLSEIQGIVSKKSQEKKLPVDLAFQLIDNKILQIKQEIAELSLKEKNLRSFKVGLRKEFA